MKIWQLCESNLIFMVIEQNERKEESMTSTLKPFWLTPIQIAYRNTLKASLNSKVHNNNSRLSKIVRDLKKKYEALRVWEQDKRTTSGAPTIAGNTDA